MTSSLQVPIPWKKFQSRQGTKFLKKIYIYRDDVLASLALFSLHQIVTVKSNTDGKSVTDSDSLYFKSLQPQNMLFQKYLFEVFQRRDVLIVLRQWNPQWIAAAAALKISALCLLSLLH